MQTPKLTQHGWKIYLTLICALCALLFGAANPARLGAQLTSGDVAGSVQDSKGAVIPGSTVTATNVATGVATTVTTNGQGEFHIPNLLAGMYNISGTASGFSAYTLKNFAVVLNSTSTARLILPVASASATAEVYADANAVLDTTTVQLQTSFQHEAIQNLPTATSGYGVLNLSLLEPDVSSSGGMGNGTGPSVGGQRPRNNNYTIEGIDNNKQDVTGPVVSVPNDARG